MRLQLIGACLAIAWSGACSGSSNATKPLTRLPLGQWSDATATLQTFNNGAALLMVCEADTIQQTLDLDGSGNFSWSGVAHVGTNITPTPSHTATFTGHASIDKVVITRNVTDDASIGPVTHELLPGTADFTPCPAKTGT